MCFLVCLQEQSGLSCPVGDEEVLVCGSVLPELHFLSLRAYYRFRFRSLLLQSSCDPAPVSKGLLRSNTVTDTDTVVTPSKCFSSSVDPCALAGPVLRQTPRACELLLVHSMGATETADYKCVIDLVVFIHHFGRRAFLFQEHTEHDVDVTVCIGKSLRSEAKDRFILGVLGILPETAREQALTTSVVQLLAFTHEETEAQDLGVCPMSM